MNKIKILIADSSYLARLGFRSMIGIKKELELIGTASKPQELSELLFDQEVDVLVIDYSSTPFTMDDVTVVHEHFPLVKILAITELQTAEVFKKAIENGVKSHLLKECEEDEILEAIQATAMNETFFCDKIVHAIANEGRKGSQNSVSCKGINLSKREIEILQLVSEGYLSKQIADKLCLSDHTISTHRKNIKKKLKINSTAGLIMLALKQDLIQNRSNILPNKN